MCYDLTLQLAIWSRMFKMVVLKVTKWERLELPQTFCLHWWQLGATLPHHVLVLIRTDGHDL